MAYTLGMMKSRPIGRREIAMFKFLIDERNAMIFEMWQLGMARGDIATAFGISCAHVRKIVRFQRIMRGEI